MLDTNVSESDAEGQISGCCSLFVSLDEFLQLPVVPGSASLLPKLLLIHGCTSKSELILKLHPCRTVSVRVFFILLLLYNLHHGPLTDIDFFFHRRLHRYQKGGKTTEK